MPFIVSSFICSVSAAQFDIDFRGNDWQFNSVDTIQTSLAPRVWETADNFPRADVIFPAAALPPQRHVLSFVHQNRESRVSIPIEIVGMEYQLKQEGQANNHGGSETKTYVLGSQVFVHGVGQGDKSIAFKQADKPFVRYRPLISAIDKNEWTQLFKSVKAPEGEYRASIMLSIPTQYELAGKKSVHYLNIPVQFKVNYTPSYLSEIDVIGDGIMKVTYSKNDTMSASANYDITATGYFTKGMQIGLVGNKRSTTYSLKAIDRSIKDDIKYSLTCTQGCDDKTQWIVNGDAKINNFENRAFVHSPFQEQAKLSLKVHFDDVPVAQSGHYRGEFVLMFSPKI